MRHVIKLPANMLSLNFSKLNGRREVTTKNVPCPGPHLPLLFGLNMSELWCESFMCAQSPKAPEHPCIPFDEIKWTLIFPREKKVREGENPNRECYYTFTSKLNDCFLSMPAHRRSGECKSTDTRESVKFSTGSTTSHSLTLDTS